MTGTGPSSSRLDDTPLSRPQERIVVAAQALFAEHGISGTSLQMIADTIGVTKAAVYHQFPTKEEIVLAAATSGLLGLERAVDAAEAEPDRARALDGLLEQVVDLAVARRRRAGLLRSDPVMARLFAEHDPFRVLMERLYRILTGDDTPDARVQAAMLSSAIGAAVVHPLVVDLDDDELRRQLLFFARRLAER